MRKFCEAIIIFLTTVGWWGFIYPELSMTPESAVQEAEVGVQEAETEDFADTSVGIGEKMGSTGIRNGNLCIKSKDCGIFISRKRKGQSREGIRL